MKSMFISILIGATMLLFGGGSSADAWSRQFFNRYSRNFLQNGAGMELGNGDAAAAAIGGAGLNANGEFDEFNALFGIGSNGGNGGNGNEVGRALAGADAAATGIMGYNPQQTEIYGIVEPLIEDQPCVDRPCSVNMDCCPSGVCIIAYGEGKCNYDFSRKRDLCHRNADCELGWSCLRGAAGNLYCQPTPIIATGSMANSKQLAVKQFGEDCETSSDCNFNKGMCCQLQRSHHRKTPKQICAFFRDPFVCIDIAVNDDERDARILSAFSQRLM